MLVVVRCRSHDHDTGATICGKATIQTHLGREFILRLPNHASCFASSPLPLVMLIHCYGCHASMEIVKFSAAADKLGFGLVAPEGPGNSWNAPSCCGPARLESRPDVEFIDALVARLLAQPTRFHASALFASGFSNGGFMTSYLAEASKVQWAGIAPTAGHEYALTLNRAPLPIHMHHCRTDGHVNMSGCCYDHGLELQTCCCNIVHRTCVAIENLFGRWLEVNKCRGSRPTTIMNLPHAQCSTGVGCAAETTLCVHGGGCIHSHWSKSFPATEQLLIFFARQLCIEQGGTRASAEDAPCYCRVGRAGPHCLHSTVEALMVERSGGAAGSRALANDEHVSLGAALQGGDAGREVDMKRKTSGRRWRGGSWSTRVA